MTTETRKRRNYTEDFGRDAVALAVAPRQGSEIHTGRPDAHPGPGGVAGLFRATISGLLALLAVSGCVRAQFTLPSGNDPLDAAYCIEEDIIMLSGGQAEHPVVSGSAGKAETRVFGKPERGDLDGDGDEDAAVILLHRAGGSGTFFYIAAAIREQAGFVGTNAVLLGDRIALQSLQIRNGVLMASYADRRATEPMAAAPTVAKTKYLTLQAGHLVEAPPFDAGVQVLEGWVTIGPEVSEFRPCIQQGALWLDRRDHDFETVETAYRHSLPPDAGPHAPVFMTLAGRLAPAPGEGFGSDYSAGFRVAGWLHPWPHGNCRADQSGH